MNNLTFNVKNVYMGGKIHQAYQYSEFLFQSKHDDTKSNTTASLPLPVQFFYMEYKHEDSKHKKIKYNTMVEHIYKSKMSAVNKTNIVRGTCYHSRFHCLKYNNK